MKDEDQPPEQIWLDGEAINAHFEALNERYKTGAPAAEAQPEMHDNEMTRGLRR